MKVTFDERLGWFLLGCALGFAIGYIVRNLRDIKEELDEVDEAVTGRKRKEKGAIDNNWTMGIALFLVVGLTAWAAFASQRAATQVETSAECTQQYLAKTIRALNARTEYAQTQATANVELQKAQAVYLNTILKQPQPPREVLINSLETYFETLQRFVKVSGRAAANAREFPFPENSELTDCLNKEE